MTEKAYLVPNPAIAFNPITFDAGICTGCYTCVDVCRTDVMVPSSEEGNPPIVLYPDECWFCGSCVVHCPNPGAIQVQHPLHQRMGWKRKDTGEYFRAGMKNPPPPNTKPPVC